MVKVPFQIILPQKILFRGWSDIKRLKWQEHVGHVNVFDEDISSHNHKMRLWIFLCECSKETLFGTPGDEFDQLAFSQEVMLRKECAIFNM